MHRHDVFAFVPPLLLRRRARRPAFRPSQGVHMKPSEKKERKFSNTLECRMQNSCIRHVVVVSFLFPCGSNIRPDHRARLGELLDSSHPSCWSLCYKTCAHCAAWALSRELRLSLTSFFSSPHFPKSKRPSLTGDRLPTRRSEEILRTFFGTTQLQKNLCAKKASIITHKPRYYFFLFL